MLFYSRSQSITTWCQSYQHMLHSYPVAATCQLSIVEIQHGTRIISNKGARNNSHCNKKILHITETTRNTFLSIFYEQSTCALQQWFEWLFSMVPSLFTWNSKTILLSVLYTYFVFVWRRKGPNRFIFYFIFTTGLWVIYFPIHLRRNIQLLKKLFKVLYI